MEQTSPGAEYAQHLAAEVDAVRRRSVNEQVRLMAAAWPSAPPSVPARLGVREYAAAHHVVALMREAARSRDRDLMRQAGHLWDAFTATGAVPGGVVAVDHSAAVPLTGAGSDTPVWAITAEAAARAADGTQWVRPAAAAAGRWGYEWLIGRALAIVVTLHARRLDEATSSWTVSTLPCTVYTDHYPLPSLMGKDLVHEAAHSWLNDCLAASRDELTGPAEYWSPWKQRNRTPFGMVHSGFAFSCVVNFLTGLAAATSDPAVAGYCERRLPAERGRLTEARPGIERALDVVRDDRVRAMVAAELAMATDGGGAG